jgi:hypothetical protein
MSRAAADAWLDQLLDAFEGKLEARRNQLGDIRWPQVLVTHTDSNIPADGVGTVPDNLDAVAQDNGDGWSNLQFSVGGPWDAALRVDNYGQRLGDGYVIVSYVREGGALYVKARNNGPEAWRSHGWREVGEP